MRSVGSTILTLVLFATYLGIGALAHDMHFSLGWALAMYARAMKRLSAVIGDQDPSLLSTIMRTRGSHPFYQVRIGADTRPAADDLCSRIRRAGGACFVLRNFSVRS